MSLMQLIYASCPFGFDENTLNGILSSARRNNRPLQITGALICRADLYLQLLEGPQASIDTAFDRIRRDERHTEVTLLYRAEVESRLFPTWDMLDDPARSWMWTQAEVAAGAVTRASADELRAVFERIAAQPNAALEQGASG